MGTNYYWRHNICPHCGRYEEAHIGKSSMGWQFLFHGYRDNLLPLPDPEVDLKVKVLSWKDWKELLSKEGKIFNEYGAEVPLADLVANVEAPERKTMISHYDYCQEHHESDLKKMWKDPEGYTFWDREWS
jgi:hypothetical protein